VIIGLAIFLIFLFTLFMREFIGWTFGTIIILAAYFILRSFYFALFELKWQGQTPGKRLMGIRVIKRSGGRIDAGAIFARNLMREVEIYIPLSLVFASGQLGAAGWVVILSLLWSGLMLFLPFFNKDCLRAGDIIGGTWVISVPKTVLLPEVGRHVTEEPGEALPKFHFTKQQLGIYGIYELQTLENILRREGKDKDKLFDEVVGKIQTKINWTVSHSHEEAVEFLRAFYSALRRHLESDMLMGRRKENKFASPDGKSNEATIKNPVQGRKVIPPKKIKNPLYKGD
jgi:uncharacterized RDD family membrane protein YckC/sulfur relay (sulfurtransferase) DsrC/TusE family protein